MCVVLHMMYRCLGGGGIAFGTRGGMVAVGWVGKLLGRQMYVVCIVYCVAEVCSLAGSTTVHIGRQDSRNRNDSMPLTGSLSTFTSSTHRHSCFSLGQLLALLSLFLLFSLRTPPVHLAVPDPPPPFTPFHPLDLSHSFFKRTSFSSRVDHLPRIVPLGENLPRA